ncbi:hypothetical protein KIN20_029562 [Parelaphostrongylus tenuis]|uniref:Uncharacterized protein n=1 Tax=Parelaphostrongylus tenuis TaxID=148309 RepID=A0AAD5WFQ0_PARTN|nr:hypothetical protein KIN20_029562 [Parelaphostrongylus tenuis]
MVRLSTGLLIILLLSVTTVLGCGVLPQARTRNFTVTGFTLPVNMVYSDDATVRTKAFGVAASKEAAQGFVSRTVMRTVIDVLEQQGRSALLPDAIISSILSQLMVQISYEPLECKAAATGAELNAQINGMPTKLPHCIIVGSAVTALCGIMATPDCTISTNQRVITIPDTAKSISGTLTTTNVIMANWSKEMWQRVMNRAVRILASSGPFGSHFFSAVATVG